MTFVAQEHPEEERGTRSAGAEGHRLGDLRKRTGVTQMELARLMGIGQPRVSAIERGDIDTLTLASLRAYIEGLGGTLQIVARVNDSEVSLQLPSGTDRSRTAEAGHL